MMCLFGVDFVYLYLLVRVVVFAGCFVLGCVCVLVLFIAD